MDRDVSPSIAYWATSFDADMEALASEVACLRRNFRPSIVWGVNGRPRWPVSWRNGWSFHPRLQLLFRGLTAVAQHAFDINHVFGSLGDWYHLRAVRKRPTILTVAVTSKACGEELLSKVDRFVVEWPSARDELLGMGIERERVELVFPPVDLDRFRPSPRPPEPFTVLFASSPDRADWVDDRGVGLLLEAARQRPEWRFKFVWRPWGSGVAEVRRRIKLLGLPNVELVVGRVGDMSEHYAQAHVTVAPFLCPQRSKPSPNSLVESFASGRPVVVTQTVGLAEVVEEENIGRVTSSDVGSLLVGFEEVRGDWHGMSVRARAAAERWFDEDTFLSSYARIYECVMSK
jgi:glycosyltransferase involved in cell wall biosynthesis